MCNVYTVEETRVGNGNALVVQQLAISGPLDSIRYCHNARLDVRAYQGFLKVDLGGLDDHAYMDSRRDLQKRALESVQISNYQGIFRGL